jgi:hypothetical protein
LQGDLVAWCPSGIGDVWLVSGKLVALISMDRTALELVVVSSSIS